MRTFKTVASLMMALSVFAGSKDAKTAAPAYPRKAEITFDAKISEVREVVKGSPLDGVYLTVTAKSDTLDVYVGPKDFVKLFGVTLTAGQEVEIKGAKISVDGSELILAREIKVGRVTLIMRDDDGWPNWDYNKPRPFPTGL